MFCAFRFLPESPKCRYSPSVTAAGRCLLPEGKYLNSARHKDPVCDLHSVDRRSVEAKLRNMGPNKKISILIILCLVLPLLSGGCASLPKIEEFNPFAREKKPPRIVGPDGDLSKKRGDALIKGLERKAEGTELLKKQTAVMEAISASPLASGNKCTLLVDGPAAIAAMMKAIEGAKDNVNFESYIFESGETGQAFADLLLKKQAEGVQVNLIYDSVGSKSVPASFFDRMRNGGIQVLEFNPVNPFKARRKWLLSHRDHRKILVVDGRIAFTGGVNISDVYSAGSTGKYLTGSSHGPWRDTHVQIEGPVVAEIQKLFIETWERQKGPELRPRDYFPRLEKKGDDLVRVVGSVPGQKPPLTYLMYISAISYAESTIHLTSAYFVPNDELVEALMKAQGRGVDVKIILPSASDVGVVYYAGRSFYTTLLKSGVKLYERRGSVLHAKTAVVDGVWSTIGSTNLDLWSFLRNDEANTIILSIPFAEEMEKMFVDDLNDSKEILLEEWKDRTLSDRMKEWFSRWFKYFL